MEGLRSASSRLLALETQRVNREREDVYATLRSGRLGVNAMTALSLLALVLFLRQTLAFDRVHRQHALAMQAERDRLRAEAARRTADLTELARHLQSVREDEKSRLARTLSDELGALLTAAKLDAARLKRAIGPPTPEVQARLVHLNASIDRGIGLKRRIIEELRPSSLANLGLVAALQILTRDHAARSEVRLDTELQPVALVDSAQMTVYRLVQEALTNAYRHGGGVGQAVSLCYDAGRLHVEVSDGGPGFVDGGAAEWGKHLGLVGMRERVESLGGNFRVASAPGQGTKIIADVTVDGEEANDG